MSKSVHEQFIRAVERAKDPVIVLRHNASIDDFTAACSVARLLKERNKPVNIVSSGGKLPKELDFLNFEVDISADFNKLNKLTIEIDTEKAQIDSLHYNDKGNKMAIDITPKDGTWDISDIAVKTDAYRHDLIIVIGAEDLTHIGPLFEKYSDFFHETPIVNIDYSPSNEHFGQINIVDINSISCSEVCYETICRTGENLIDDHLATCILTGMIEKSRSFRSENVTPKTLRVAGDLVAKGAKRDEIVQKLYKTRSVETLRLWGRALARLKVDEEKKLVWSLVTKQDFANAGAGKEALPSIIDEIITTTPMAKVIVLIYETTDGHDAIVQTSRPHDALALTQGLSNSGNQDQATVHTSKTDIVDAEKTIITKIKEQI